MRKTIEEDSAKKREMALALAEHYSSLSPKSCLQNEKRDEALYGGPLTDLPLMADKPRSFVVPRGIEVGVR